MSSTPQVSVNQTLMKLLSTDAALASNAAQGEAEAGQSFNAALLQMLGLQSASGIDSATAANGLLLPGEGGEALPLATHLPGEAGSAELNPELLQALQQRFTELVASLRGEAGSNTGPLSEAELAELPLDELQLGIQAFFKLDESAEGQAVEAAEVLQQLLRERRTGQADTGADIAQLTAAGMTAEETAQAERAAVKEAITELLAADNRQATPQAGERETGAATGIVDSAATGRAATETAATASADHASTVQRVAEAVTQVVQELRRTATDVQSLPKGETLASQPGSSQAAAAQALSAQVVSSQAAQSATAQSGAHVDAQQHEAEQQRLQQALARGERVDVPAREVNVDASRLQYAQAGQQANAQGFFGGASATALSAGLGGRGADAESDTGQQRNPQSGLSAFQQLQQAYRGGTSHSVTLNLPESFGGQRWTEGLSQRIVWMSNQQVGRAELRLDPPDLGTLNIRLSIQNDQASLSISSPHAHVREALEQQMPRLREMLAEKGIDLQQSDVSDQSSSQQYASDERSGSGRGQSSANHDGAEGETEATALMNVSGGALSMVDYYA